MFLVRRGRARVVYYQQQQLLGMNTDSIKHPKNERWYNYSLEEHELVSPTLFVVKLEKCLYVIGNVL